MDICTYIIYIQLTHCCTPKTWMKSKPFLAVLPSVVVILNDMCCDNDLFGSMLMDPLIRFTVAKLAVLKTGEAYCIKSF